MKIICAFDSFKGCMTAKDACHAAASGLQEYYPEAEILCLPMSDGGEGMVECIAEAVGAEMVSVMVHDPLMQMMETQYAVSADGTTAYMEMAAASGLTLVPEDKRNPMLTTTYGVGEMILDAVERGCKQIVMGIGGSATCDGGKGMIECLEGQLPLPVKIIVASDVSNPLYGENGAAYVFAPQKGATTEQVKLLDEQLRNFARETESKGIALPDLAHYPGAGAAGGLGYGLMAYLGATLQSGIDLLLDTIHFDEQVRGADFILTGEGKSDKQTLMGKVPEGILKRAMKQNIPVHLLSGAIEDVKELKDAGFASALSINQNDPRPLEILMQKDVAMENMRKTASKPEQGNLFMNDTISFRNATISDALFIAKGFHMAMLYDDASEEQIANFARNICVREDVLYSWRNTIIAEVEGKPAGMLTAYDGRYYHEMRIRTMTLVKQHIGVEFPGMEDEAVAGEYYLDSLAVMPEYRGRGIGRKLLQKGIENGKTLHLDVTLAVDPINNRAKKLYQSLGFKPSGTLFIFGHDYEKMIIRKTIENTNKNTIMKSFGSKPWMLPQPVLIIGTYNENGVANAMNAAWGGTWDMHEIMISLGSHATTDNLKLNNGEFTVAFATAETMVASDFVGIVSAKNDPEKMTKTGWTAEKAPNVNAPLFKEFPMAMECRIKQKIDESETGYYLVAEVVNILCDEQYLNEQGNPDVEKMNIISYEPVNHKYIQMGKVIGDAFSCGKELK